MTKDKNNINKQQSQKDEENKKKKRILIPALFVGILGGLGLTAGLASLGMSCSYSASHPIVTFVSKLDGSKLDGATSIEISNTTKFKEVNKPKVTAPTGKEFTCWTYDEKGENLVQETDVIKSASTLYAQYKENTEYNIKFENKEGMPEAEFTGPASVTIKSEQTFGEINKPTAKTKTHPDLYTFEYWSTDGTQAGKIFDTTKITKDTVLYPVFLHQSGVYRNVTFSKMDEEPVDTVIKFNNLDTLTLSVDTAVPWRLCNRPEATKTKTVDGTTFIWEFKGWKIKQDSAYVDIDDEHLFEENTTVYPEFANAPVIYQSEYFIKDNDKVGKITDSSEYVGDEIKITWDDGTTTSEPKTTFNKKVYIGDRITSISPNFLKGCTAFNQKIDIPSTVTFIGEGFLSGCTSFNNGATSTNDDNELVIPDIITDIGGQFMYNCSSFNQKLTLGKSVWFIGNSFMEGCSSFNQTLELPESLANIGTYFMSGCTSFNNGSDGTTDIPFVFPSKLGSATTTAIGYYCFYNCTGITNLTINLSKCTYMTSTPQCFMQYAQNFCGSVILPTTIKVISENFLQVAGYATQSIEGKKVTVNWSELTNLEKISYCCCNGSNIQDEVDLSNSKITSIDHTFLGSNGKFNSQIKLPNTLVSIGPNFLNACTTFDTELVLPSSLKSIDKTFMKSCVAYNQKLDLSNTQVEEIGEQFMYSAAKFNSALTFPTTLKTIGGYFLYQCASFNNPIDLSNTQIQSIGDYFMYLAYKFNQSIAFPLTLKQIGGAFMYACLAFNQEIDLSNTQVQSIGDYFMYNQYLSSKYGSFNGKINFPNTLQTIGNYFLRSCVNFDQQLSFPSSLKTIGSYFMYGCQNFNQKIDLSKTQLVTIGDFFLDTHINKTAGIFNSEVILPQTLETIGQGFMLNCIKFNQDITLPSSLKSIGAGLFANCTSIAGSIDLSSVNVNSITISTTQLLLNNENTVTFKVASGTTDAWKTKLGWTSSKAWVFTEV